MLPDFETNLADLRTDGAKRVRIANGLSRLVRKHNRRNSVSMEQIQDTSYCLLGRSRKAAIHVCCDNAAAG